MSSVDQISIRVLSLLRYLTIPLYGDHDGNYRGLRFAKRWSV
jgi:hypothetical protein